MFYACLLGLEPSTYLRRVTAVVALPISYKHIIFGLVIYLILAFIKINNDLKITFLFVFSKFSF